MSDKSLLWPSPAAPRTVSRLAILAAMPPRDKKRDAILAEAVRLVLKTSKAAKQIRRAYNGR